MDRFGAPEPFYFAVTGESLATKRMKNNLVGYVSEREREESLLRQN